MKKMLLRNTTYLLFFGMLIWILPFFKRGYEELLTAFYITFSIPALTLLLTDYRVSIVFVLTRFQDYHHYWRFLLGKYLRQLGIFLLLLLMANGYYNYQHHLGWFIPWGVYIRLTILSIFLSLSFFCVFKKTRSYLWVEIVYGVFLIDFLYSKNLELGEEWIHLYSIFTSLQGLLFYLGIIILLSIYANWYRGIEE
ncbi:hypothetical protein [Bulleidia sp. zg-1006]|uniref:hypothetical protein n=1 Tax=Bulleidia sp. zg-1006 TaxID=2806552 RepID=UPI0019399925|nr:hypothetical protein [Bulleidia sp. zg-1006]QRG86808.1 hypothetical protein JOS54_00360 [Bulleidia sp. zg-1006]